MCKHVMPGQKVRCSSCTSPPSARWMWPCKTARLHPKPSSNRIITVHIYSFVSASQRALDEAGINCSGGDTSDEGAALAFEAPGAFGHGPPLGALALPATTLARATLPFAAVAPEAAMQGPVVGIPAFGAALLPAQALGAAGAYGGLQEARGWELPGVGAETGAVMISAPGPPGAGHAAAQAPAAGGAAAGRAAATMQGRAQGQLSSKRRLYPTTAPEPVPAAGTPGAAPAAQDGAASKPKGALSLERMQPGGRAERERVAALVGLGRERLLAALYDAAGPPHGLVRGLELYDGLLGLIQGRVPGSARA